MGRRRGRCYALGATAGGYVRGARNGETGRGGGGFRFRLMMWLELFVLRVRGGALLEGGGLVVIWRAGGEGGVSICWRCAGSRLLGLGFLVRVVLCRGLGCFLGSLLTCVRF